MKALKRRMKLSLVPAIAWYVLVCGGLIVRCFASEKPAEIIVFFLLWGVSLFVGTPLISYPDWLWDIKKAATEKELYFPGAFRYEIKPKFVTYMPFDRFLSLYLIDQKNAWTVGNTCYYTIKKSYYDKTFPKKLVTEETVMYVYFGFIDYLRFLHYQKQLEKKKQREKTQKKDSAEIEAQKEFIKSLQDEIDDFLKSDHIK